MKPILCLLLGAAALQLGGHKTSALTPHHPLSSSSLSSPISVPEDAPSVQLPPDAEAGARRGNVPRQGFFRRIINFGRNWMRDASRKRGLKKRLKQVLEAVAAKLNADPQFTSARAVLDQQKFKVGRRTVYTIDYPQLFTSDWLYLRVARRRLFGTDVKTVRVPVLKGPKHPTLAEVRHELAQNERDRRKLPRSIRSRTLAVRGRGQFGYASPQTQTILIGVERLANLGEVTNGLVAPLPYLPPETLNPQDKAYLSLKASEFALRTLNAHVVFPNAGENSFWLSLGGDVVFTDTQKAVSGPLSAAIGGGTRYRPLAYALAAALRNLWCNEGTEQGKQPSQQEEVLAPPAAEDQLGEAAPGEEDQGAAVTLPAGGEYEMTNMGVSPPQQEESLTTQFVELFPLATGRRSDTCKDEQVAEILAILAQEDPREGFEACFNLFRSR